MDIASPIALVVPRWLLLVALAGPTVGTIGYFVLASGAEQTWLFRLTYAVVKVAQFALPLGFMFCVQRDRLKAVRRSGRGLLGGLMVGGLTAFLMLGVYVGFLREGPEFANVGPVIRAKVAGFGVHSPTTYIGLVFFISVLHSLVEEYYWRWFVFAGLRHHYSLFGALAISSIGFAAHHVVVLNVYFPQHFWTATVPFALGVAVGGWVWAWWYERTGSLAGPWAAHMGADLGIMAVGYDLLYR